MTRTLRHKALCLLLLAATACTNDEVFYSIDYPVERIDVLVATSDTPQEGEEANPFPEMLRQELLASAPVTAGGGYALDFTKHDGGPLEVRPNTGGEIIQGVFVKTPGLGTLRFIYGEQDYTCTILTYTATDGASKVVLTEDFTEHYKALYPTANLTQVIRQAYTSTKSQ